ncbi:hypothetical protein SARC_06152 [Sphaeroforma arctica JP610]|uniref:Uncharacterized protein n=1 Tax=Sphaeroforma arctica JP610 TaxID=667725 RepID=A0A0L0FXF6_9EUKA|nr:hypothetical protein SARC_06152 [Sphaeroforma arctica JP610]KNC81525.1 hypothetical protein SARC_06152 [Sphaeroforma arctica JP610]|eukprot:XP_014155427.1 hypothetical protein SARC_06152 [Sphaeroforma arctica JP610]
MSGRGLFAAIRTLTLAGGGALGLTYWSRHNYDMVLRKKEFDTKAHKDTTKPGIKIERQVEPKTRVWFRSSEGHVESSILPKSAATSLMRERLRHLENRRAEIRSSTAADVKKNVNGVFENIEDRIGKFADWYFSYPTTYKLLSTASASVARNIFRSQPEGYTMGDAVALDVVKYIQKKYELIVLRPELNDRKLERAFLASFQHMQREYHRILDEEDDAFRNSVESETTHTEPLAMENITMDVDWASQLNKINSVVAGHEKGPEGAGVGAALMVGGAAVGKAGGLAGLKGASIGLGKAGTGAATKGFLGKLAAPFATKAVSAGSVAGGTAAAGLLAGPLGAVAGAVMGLGADYSINAGVELLQRESFEQEMREGLRETRDTWEELFNEELQRVLDVWMSDTVLLMSMHLDGGLATEGAEVALEQIVGVE